MAVAAESLSTDLAGYQEDEQDVFGRRLRAMVRDGEIMFDRKGNRFASHRS